MREIRARIRYAVDNALSKGLWLLLPWMAGGLLLAVAMIAMLIWLWEAGPQDQGVPFTEAFWLALTRSLDPGTFGQDEGPHFRVAGLAITVVGLLAIALLIGLIANAVDRRLDELRQGRSIVVESNHTLILGVSSKLPLIVSELLEANRSRRNTCIVVLAPADKVELEQLLRREIPSRAGRVVVRRGEPASIYELQQGRPESASNIIVVRPDEVDADAEVVKVVLAVCQAREDLPTIPIVAELHDPHVARSLRNALPGKVMTVVGTEVVARVAAQTSRAAGLGFLYQDLLDFGGDEIYFAKVPTGLTGRSFFEAMMASDHCSVIGISREHSDAVLCPDFSTVLEAGDELVLLADDDSRITFRPSPALTIPTSERNQLLQDPPRRERTLIIGWNTIAGRVIDEIDEQVAHGSEIFILIDEAATPVESTLQLGPWPHQVVTILRGSMIDQGCIVDALDRGPFDHILVLCPHENVTPIQADARSLLALLHVRSALEERLQTGHLTNVVTEVMRGEAVALAQVARPDDFIVSQRLISLLMAQLAEDPRRKPVLHEILDSHGAQLQLRSVDDCGINGEYSYREIIELTSRMGVIALGWKARSYSHDSRSLRGGLRLNPSKNERVHLTSEDKLILLCPRSEMHEDRT